MTLNGRESPLPARRLLRVARCTWRAVNCCALHRQSTDHEGFYLLESLIQFVPLDHLRAFVPTILQLLFHRLQVHP